MEAQPIEQPGHVDCTRLPEPKLGPALKEWCRIQSKFLRANEEGPFIYKERAQIGFLAAAIWLSGGIALEEWDLKKARAGGEAGSAEPYEGRSDLWFTIDSEPAEYPGGWYLEAKHDFIDADSVVERLGDRWRSGLAEAMVDASKLEARFSRLACKFLSIQIPRGTKTFDLVYQSLNADLKAARPDADAFAWFVAKPNQMKSLIEAQPGRQNCAIATILLIARC